MVTATLPCSVFVLAQNRLLREALARILDKKTYLNVVRAQEFSAHSILDLAVTLPDVLLMDSLTSECSHLEFVRQVRECTSGTRIVLIGMDQDEQCFLQAVREGVLGYLLKDASALEVVAAVRKVASGEAVCPPSLCTLLFQYIARQRSHLPSLQVKLSLGLTNREQQLVLLIGRGLTNKEIANQLNLAEQTVRNHVHRMLRKVGVNDRLAAVEMCRMQGLAV
jgi:DNA-binding NarL/FixJ family response regulator